MTDPRLIVIEPSYYQFPDCKGTIVSVQNNNNNKHYQLLTHKFE